MSKIYLTSDTHFGHTNVILYCKRPFLKDASLGWVKGNLDTPAMDKALIDNWNEVVTPGDTVYHLGDFAFGPKAVAAAIRERLNGNIILVRGNHDGSITRCRDLGFKEVVDYTEVVIGGIKVHMSHQPLIGYQPDGIYLNGHVHEKWTYRDFVQPKRIAVNVGVDVWGFKPRTLGELVAADYQRNSDSL